MWRPKTKSTESDFELLKKIKKRENDFSEMKKKIEEEDSEFLDEVEKQRRLNYLSKKSKIQEVINRRIQTWNNLEKERLEIGSFRFSEQSNNYDVEYYYEEVVKTEENRIKSLIDN